MSPMCSSYSNNFLHLYAYILIKKYGIDLIAIDVWTKKDNYFLHMHITLSFQDNNMAD